MQCVPDGISDFFNRNDGRRQSVLSRAYAGQVYQIEVRESYQILYLILSKKTARILVYDDAKQSVQIGNKVNVKGELSLFEEARNPGNFDQKFYYEKQKIRTEEKLCFIRYYFC